MENVNLTAVNPDTGMIYHKVKVASKHSAVVMEMSPPVASPILEVRLWQSDDDRTLYGFINTLHVPLTIL